MCRGMHIHRRGGMVHYRRLRGSPIRKADFASIRDAKDAAGP